MADALKIPFLADGEIRPITGGFSTDKKFVVTKGNSKYLFRTFPVAEFERKTHEFKALKLMAEFQVKSSRALELDYIPGGEEAYMLLTFIEGADGEHAMPSISGTRQYEIGLQAGKELRKIHQCTAPKEIPEWNERKLPKHQRYLKQYLNGGTRIEGADKVIRFIDDNTFLMRDRPNLFQHDDFHLRNLIINNSELAGIIDFGRHDWGDPLHEFLKIGQFNTEISIPFSKGQIMGYFDGAEPDETFWRLYALYSAMSIFSFIVWTKHAWPETMDKTLSIINRVLKDHDWFKNPKPSWFE
jgi:aminoglycoside phosphotransferase (APT) family kinase protein